MKAVRSYGMTLSKIIAFIVAFALVSSLCLHAVQLRHVHLGDGAASGHHHHHKAEGNQLSEYLHAAEKKTFTIALLASFFTGSVLFTFLFGWRRFLSLQILQSKVTYAYDLEPIRSLYIVFTERFA